MGLDMYLFSRDEGNTPDVYKSEEELALVPEDQRTYGGFDDPFPQKKFYYVDDAQQEAYWRKANSIHRWFVENVQNGVDECEPHEVTLEQLIELKDTALYVLDAPSQSEERLPTQGGFFFGSVDYDEHYGMDLKDTVEMLDGVIQRHTSGRMYIYQSSW